MAYQDVGCQGPATKGRLWGSQPATRVSECSKTSQRPDAERGARPHGQGTVGAQLAAMGIWQVRGPGRYTCTPTAATSPPRRPGAARSDAQLRRRLATLHGCPGGTGLADTRPSAAGSGRPRASLRHRDLRTGGLRARDRGGRCGVLLRSVQPTAGLAAVMSSAIREHAGDAGYLAERSQWSGHYGTPLGVAGQKAPCLGAHALQE
jgi:hypothetical protein